VIDHCVSALKSKRDDELFRVYVTDALKSIAGNTARFNGGTEMNTRFKDILDPPEEDDRTPDEIICSISEKLKRL
jgi:hypothetical protein